MMPNSLNLPFFSIYFIKFKFNYNSKINKFYTKYMS